MGEIVELVAQFRRMTAEFEATQPVLSKDLSHLGPDVAAALASARPALAAAIATSTALVRTLEATPQYSHERRSRSGSGTPLR